METRRIEPGGGERVSRTSEDAIQSAGYAGAGEIVVRLRPDQGWEMYRQRKAVLNEIGSPSGRTSQHSTEESF